jgi:hypothetical protein
LAVSLMRTCETRSLRLADSAVANPAMQVPVSLLSHLHLILGNNRKEHSVPRGMRKADF